MDVQELFTRIGDTLSVRRSFGAAYEKDGLLVIPVALVAGGGGGGGAAELSEAGAGEGGGFGGVVMPLGVYVAHDDEVRWVPAWDALFLMAASLAVLRVVGRLFARTRRV